MSVVVHVANIHDTKGGISTAKRAYEQYPSDQKFCADAGYRGTFISDLKEQLDLDVMLIFQRKSSPINGKNFPGDRWWSAPSLGPIIPDGSAKVIRFPSLPLKLWL